MKNIKNMLLALSFVVICACPMFADTSTSIECRSFYKQGEQNNFYEQVNLVNENISLSIGLEEGIWLNGTSEAFQVTDIIDTSTGLYVGACTGFSNGLSYWFNFDYFNDKQVFEHGVGFHKNVVNNKISVGVDLYQKWFNSDITNVDYSYNEIKTNIKYNF